jgi:hypothetical protein
MCQSANAACEWLREHGALREDSVIQVQDAARRNAHPLGENALAMHPDERPVAAEILVANPAFRTRPATNQGIDGNRRTINCADDLVT